MMVFPSRSAILTTVLLMIARPGCAQSPDAAGHAPAPVSIPDDRYVTVSDDGHLQLEGERVRYWGFIGHMVGDGIGDKAFASDQERQARVDQVRFELEQMVDRIDTLGFNLVRSWEGGYGQRSAFIYEGDYVKGDGSRADLIAYYFHLLDAKGIKLWMSSLNNLGPVRPEDVGIIDDPDTADAWSQAMEALIQSQSKGSAPQIRSHTMDMVRQIDPRVEALMIQRMREFADFPNHYKGGLRIGDDPQVAVWEISNEQFIFRSWFNGKWQALPDFFRDQLYGHWHAFLKQKYVDDAGLVEAWRFVLPGESLADATVALLPLASPTQPAAALNDANPNLAEQLKVIEQAYGRDDFTRQRGADVVEFFTQLTIAHQPADRRRAQHDGQELPPLADGVGQRQRLPHPGGPVAPARRRRLHLLLYQGDGQRPDRRAVPLLLPTRRRPAQRLGRALVRAVIHERQAALRLRDGL